MLHLYQLLQGVSGASNATYTGILPNQQYRAWKRTQLLILLFQVAQGQLPQYILLIEEKDMLLDDVLTFRDPDDSSKTAAFTISSVNITGLALMASSDNSGKTEWKSGIVGNGSTSKYIDDNYDNNYIANGDFTNGTTSWTSGSKVTAAEAIEQEVLGMMSMTVLCCCKKVVFNGNALLNPWDNSWDEYIYQDVTLDENTTYHLNFLYDNFESNGGIAVAVYDTTKIQKFF